MSTVVPALRKLEPFYPSDTARSPGVEHKTKLACRRLRNELFLLPRRIDASRRMLPELVILGAQKAGTTSLFNYLSQHPQVQPPIRKEVHYFDLNFVKGPTWYRAHFPQHHHAAEGPRRNEERLITFDSSPYYLFHPAVPERLKAMLPQAKFVAMLRNPVDRAYSHYWHEVKLGHERLPLPAAFAEEDSRLRGEMARLGNDARYKSFAHRHYSYLSRGLYVEQIKRWFELFSPERFLFIKSERFFADPDSETNRILRFVGLTGSSHIHYRPFNVGQYRKIDPNLRQVLTEFYKPFDLQLSELLGQDFSW
jgi:hypothetical protein